MLFTKLQGLGNDYLVSSALNVADLENPAETARRICDRHFGAGSDGIVFVSQSHSPDADFQVRIFNPDGHEAEVSGNGTRCAAAYLYYTRNWSAGEIRLATAAGVKKGRLVASDGLRFDFEFEIGEPGLSSDAVGMKVDPRLERVVGYDLALGSQVVHITATSMGNPHCTLFVADVDRLDIDELGPLIENHPVFTNRTNVEFVQVKSTDEIEVLFWERGVGRTLSSGTGSCAAAVASSLNGLTGRKVTVRTAGGALKVSWGADNIVRLTGSAEPVYHGEWLRKAD